MVVVQDSIAKKKDERILTGYFAKKRLFVVYITKRALSAWIRLSLKIVPAMPCLFMSKPAT